MSVTGYYALSIATVPTAGATGDEATAICIWYEDAPGVGEASRRVSVRIDGDLTTKIQTRNSVDTIDAVLECPMSSARCLQCAPEEARRRPAPQPVAQGRGAGCCRRAEAPPRTALPAAREVVPANPDARVLLEPGAQ